MHSLLVVIEALPAILPGIIVTVGNVAISLGLGLLLMGMPFAVGQVYGPRQVRRLVALLRLVFRGVPILVLLFSFLWFFHQSGFAGRTLCDCQRRAGLHQRGLSIANISRRNRKPAQWPDSGRPGPWHDRCPGHIAHYPAQAMRLSIPGWANEFSILLKDSAICFVLGTQDIMARTSFAAARTHEHLALLRGRRPDLPYC